MRVVQVDAGREMRGGQWQTLRLLDGLRARGIDTALSARAGSPLFAAAERAGHAVTPLSFLALSRMAHAADLAHAHDARAHTLLAMVCGARFVVSRRVAFPIGSHWKYARARHYLAVSQYVKRMLIQGGVPPEKISVIGDGVPLPALASTGRLVLIPASRDPRKGTALAMEACRAAGAAPLVSERIEEDLKQAAILVYLSECEGLGSAALLAMAAGVPVIASRTGGLPEIVRDGETGLLVENAAPAIASAIQSLLEDESTRLRLGNRAREIVAANFTVDHMVNGAVDVYRQVIGSA
jgi:hypothetical protein